MTELDTGIDFAKRYGPRAVIAGASEGTGRAFARQIAAHGVRCILIARREGPLRALAREIQAGSGIESVIASVDLAAPGAADRIATVVGDRVVGLYISNAGADPNGSCFLDLDIGAWNDLVNRNVVTTMQCCHHFGRQMRVRGKDGILLVNSYACYGGGSFLSIYSASKTFDLCLSESLWSELGPHGVHVLGLVLNMTDTPAFNALLTEKGLPKPPGVASPDAVAELGLSRLPFGPVQNWGLEDDEAGGAPTSAASRRARVIGIDQVSQAAFGPK